MKKWFLIVGATFVLGCDVETGSCVDLASGNCVDGISRADCDGTYAPGKSCAQVDVKPGVIVDDNGTKLSYGEESSEPMPTNTTTGDEAQVVQTDGAAWVSSGSSHILEIQYDSQYPITTVHLDIGGKHFVAPAVIPAFDLPTCQELLEPQGQTCTEECAEACGCLECPAGFNFEDDALVLACAVTCSTNVNGGLVGPDQPYTSEEDLANTIYNGRPDLGVAGAAPTECDTSLCAARADAQAQKTTKVEFVNNNLDHIKNIEVNAMVVQSSPPAQRDSISSGSATQVYDLKMPGDCAPGRCPCIRR